MMDFFCLASKDAVLHEYWVSATITGLICLAADVFYALIRTCYHATLETLAATDDSTERHYIIYQTTVNIGQSRYMDWSQLVYATKTTWGYIPFRYVVPTLFPQANLD